MGQKQLQIIISRNTSTKNTSWLLTVVVMHSYRTTTITTTLCSRRQPRQHLISQIFTGQKPFLTPNQQRQST